MKLSAKNKNCFRYKDVIAEFPEKDPSHLSKVLASMVSMNREGYYIAYSSAIYIHGLTDQPGTRSTRNQINQEPDQPGTRTMVVTERQRQPSKKKYQRDRVLFYIPCQGKNRSPKVALLFSLGHYLIAGILRPAQPPDQILWIPSNPVDTIRSD